MDYRKRIFLLVSITTIVRLFAASTIELGNDEVYYAGYAQHLQWNYFDHPPMVAVWIRASTLNLWLQYHELFIRLGAIIAAALCTLLIAQTGKLLQHERAGWLAALMYNASLYAGIIAGTFILPDSPQMLFWCMALYSAARLLSSTVPRSRDWITWGLAAGLCMMSKVHGVFLWTGMGLYILCYQRAWLRHPGLYLALLLSMILVSPILWWNMQNDFATWRFHSARVAVNSFHFNTDGFFREIAGQLLYNNPVVVVLVTLALWRQIRTRQQLSAPVRFFLLVALPMVGLLLGIAAFRDTLPHWSGPAYCTLFLPAAIFIGKQQRLRVKRTQNWLLGALLLNVAIICSGCWVVNYYPGTLSKNTDKSLGDGDPTLDMYGWTELGMRFRALRQQLIDKGQAKNNAVLLCHKWFPAAHLDYYVCRYQTPALVVEGPPEDIHHYAWLNTFRPRLETGQDAWCIIPSNNMVDVWARYGRSFSAITLAGVIPISRNGLPVKNYYVYIMEYFKPA